MTFKNLVHTTTYEKNGEQKKKYTNVGTLFIYDDGNMGIKLDSIPVNFDGKLAVYDRDEKPKQQPAQSQYAQPAPAPSMPPMKEQDIPF